MTYKNILIAVENGIATLTVNRPDKMNALNMETVGEIGAAIGALGADKGVRVVIVTGSGDKAFVAGADIAAMREMTPAEALDFAKAGHSCMRAIEECPKPVIAAVNGFALGGGAELALACDIIYAAENARFGLPEVKLGLYPGFGGTQRLPRLIGPMKAREMIFSGRVIDAKLALEWGIANKVVPAAELMIEVKKLVGEIIGNGPIAISIAKELIRKGMDVGLAEALEREKKIFPELFKTTDRVEGLSAFLEKRKPCFRGV